MKSRTGVGKAVLIATTALFLLAIAALIVLRPRQPDAPAPPEKHVAVTVLEIRPERLEDRLVLPGRAEALEDVTVSAEQTGRITALLAREGETVRAGDPLLRIDDRLWAAAEENAALREADTRRDAARAEELHAQGAIPLRDLEAARTAAESARIALREVRVQRERCTPASPIAGRVETRFVSEGEYVHAGQPLARILNASTVKVLFDLPERDVLSLRAGDACAVRFDALPETVYTGAVAVAAASANPASNAFRMEAHVDNAGGRIRAGMIARVEVLRGVREDALALPLFAVVPMEGESVAYVVEDGRSIRRIVRINRIVDSRAVIDDGLSAGDRVILDGNRNVLDGTPVRIVPEWNPQPVPQANAARNGAAAGRIQP